MDELSALFDVADFNNDGSVDKYELSGALKSIGILDKTERGKKEKRKKKKRRKKACAHPRTTTQRRNTPPISNARVKCGGTGVDDLQKHAEQRYLYGNVTFTFRR